ncbi:F-box domain-containing protein [Mycena kentingensis (nom. inval.)]|nr:F-box domain-containing protein [Mycena kentingensis (nom. inval.)]
MRYYEQEDIDELREALDDAREAYGDACDELQWLRRENNLLTARNEALALKVALSMKTTSAQMPPEILEMILRGSLPPDWMVGQLRETLGPTLRSRTIAQKLGFTLVCKVWNGVATELLYESVYIHRVEQLSAFARTLEGRDGLGALVRNLELSCFVPAECKLLFEDEISKIFHLCPRVARFTHVPIFAVPSLSTHLPAVSTSTLTSLEFGAYVDFDVVQALLASVSTTVRSLKLGFFQLESPSFRTDLDFPLLEGLQVEVIYAQVQNPPSVGIWDWSMPALRRMWLFAAEMVNFGRNAGPIVERFLARYGNRLEFLSLSVWLDGIILEELLRPCTSLVHLVLHSKTERSWGFWTRSEIHSSWHLDSESRPTPAHTTLKYIDIWFPRVADFRLRAIDQIFVPKIRSAYPSLRACRYLDVAFDCFRDLTLRYPPDEPWAAGQSGFDTDSHFPPVATGASAPLPWDRHLRPPWLRDIEEFMLPMSSLGRTLLESTADDGGEFMPSSGPEEATSDDEENGFVSDDTDTSTDSEIDAQIDEDEGDVYVRTQINREEMLKMFSSGASD